jgi:cytochrome b subunit of formate dehydrogenase
MKKTLDASEVTKRRKKTLWFWFLLIEGLILTVTGIILGNCYEAYQTAATL